MDLTSVNENDQIAPLSDMHKQMDIPWDDPYPYFMHQVPNSDISCTTVKSGATNFLLVLKFFVHMQIIQI